MVGFLRRKISHTYLCTRTPRRRHWPQAVDIQYNTIFSFLTQQQQHQTIDSVDSRQSLACITSTWGCGSRAELPEVYMEGCFSLFRTPTGPFFHNCKFGFCAGYGDSVHVGCRDRGGYAASIVSLLYWTFGFHRLRLFGACRDTMQRVDLKWCRCLQDRK